MRILFCKDLKVGCGCVHRFDILERSFALPYSFLPCLDSEGHSIQSPCCEYVSPVSNPIKMACGALAVETYSAVQGPNPTARRIFRSYKRSCEPPTQNHPLNWKHTLSHQQHLQQSVRSFETMPSHVRGRRRDPVASGKTPNIPLS